MPPPAASGKPRIRCSSPRTRPHWRTTRVTAGIPAGSSRISRCTSLMPELRWPQNNSAFGKSASGTRTGGYRHGAKRRIGRWACWHRLTGGGNGSAWIAESSHASGFLEEVGSGIRRAMPSRACPLRPGISAARSNCPRTVSSSGPVFFCSLRESSCCG